jgi:predicted dinucleotide-binding enzyme
MRYLSLLILKSLYFLGLKRSRYKVGLQDWNDVPLWASELPPQSLAHPVRDAFVGSKAGGSLDIAVIGTGKVGSALATCWASKGHQIYLGVLDVHDFTGSKLLASKNISLYPIRQAVAKAEVVLIATPSTAIFELIAQMGDVSEKIVIDATNALRHTPAPYPTAYHCLKANTKAHIVKCFNTTGYENLKNPVYDGEGIDMFMAGDCEEAKAIACRLALDAGFSSCLDFGGSDKVELLEKLALAWFNLAYVQGGDKDIAFKLVHRQKSRGNLAS